MTPAEFPKNGPRLVTAFNTEFSRSFGGCAVDLLNPSCNPHAPPTTIHGKARLIANLGGLREQNLRETSSQVFVDLVQQVGEVVMGLRKLGLWGFEGFEFEAVVDEDGFRPGSIKVSSHVTHASEVSRGPIQIHLYNKKILNIDLNVLGPSTLCRLFYSTVRSTSNKFEMVSIFEANMDKFIGSMAPLDDKLCLKWLEKQPILSQQHIAEARLSEFLINASKPRHASGSACIELCYFIEQCRSSTSPTIREVAFSECTSLDLFNFYVEWNEKNQNRSMRQVLELLSSLITRNPTESISKTVKSTILSRVLSIIGRQTAQALVKPAFKSLECFLSKKTISPEELLTAYETETAERRIHAKDSSQDHSLASWDSFISSVFTWLKPADVSPAAGKFLVTLFKVLRIVSDSQNNGGENHSALWQRWIRTGLAKNPQILENVKNYLFPPLFKTDRLGSLAFLEDLNRQRPFSDLRNQEIDAHALLQLASMEVGKKAGLVEEPSEIRIYNKTKDEMMLMNRLGPVQFLSFPSKRSAGCIPLHEEIVVSLLSSSSDNVRPLALSVLVSSSSSIRPFTKVALDGLRSSLGLLYADSDAKFRNEVLSNTKHLIERLRGATGFLTKELDRVQFKVTHASLSVSSLQNNQQDLLDATEDLLLQHETFIRWFLEFLLGELVPTASYQRHITALKAVNLLLHSRIASDSSMASVGHTSANSTIWPFTLEIFTPRAMRLLIDLLMDPFEDVRISATDILTLALPAQFDGDVIADLPPKSGSFDKEDVKNPKSNGNFDPDIARTSHPLGLLTAFLERAKHASKQTGRADYADGVARSYQLLYSLQPSIKTRIGVLDGLVTELESMVEIAEKDLSQAVHSAPVHGHFAALNMMWGLTIPSIMSDSTIYGSDCWEQWSGLQSRMVLASSRIWEAVKDILCNDSPEGHLPDEITEIDSLDTKDVLSYSFRAAHESSNLMRTIACNLTCSWPDIFAPQCYKSFSQIGNLSFTQLSTLRHRGAFSTVSLTFSSCCALTQHKMLRSYTSSSNILQSWWKGTLECINSQASTTRRSAGIPALVTGIMGAEAAEPAFEYIMMHMKELACLPVTVTTMNAAILEQLPAVHALNVLKEVFRSSSIRRKADREVTDCFRIATDCLGSNVWPIRNAGLLLLQSLINYVLGNSEAKATTEEGWNGGAVKIPYDKYPNLAELLLKLLDTTSSSEQTEALMEAAERIFPALDIVRRAGPPLEIRHSIYSKVGTHLGSKVWHIRELAARTVCALTPDERWEAAAKSLVEMAHDSASHKHGALMAVRFIVERQLLLDDIKSTEGLSLFLESFLSPNITSTKVSTLVAAQVELGNTILDAVLSSSEAGNKSLGSLLDHILSLESSKDLYELEITFTKSSELRSHIVIDALIRRGILIATIQKNAIALKNVTNHALNFGENAALAAMKCMQKAYLSLQSQDDLIQILEACSNTVYAAKSSLVQSEGLSVIAEVLRRISDFKQEAVTTIILQLDDISKSKFNSPETQNTIYSLSGFGILSSLIYEKDEKSSSIRDELSKWGVCMNLCVRYENDMDTRYAGAQALNTVFCKEHIIEPLLQDECSLPALFSLYNGTQDDDDDIRRLNSETVSYLTGKSSTALAAAQEFTDWLATSCCSSKLFAHSIVEILIGRQNNVTVVDVDRLTIVDGAAQVCNALLEDGSLFAIEKPNLWIDEVRELKRWSAIFRRLPKNTVDCSEPAGNPSPIEVLIIYASTALLELVKQLDKFDGPWGWSSRPTAFAVCIRVVVCANIVVSYGTSNLLVPGTNKFGLSLDALGQQISDVVNLSRLFLGSSSLLDFAYEKFAPSKLPTTNQTSEQLAKAINYRPNLTRATSHITHPHYRPNSRNTYIKIYIMFPARSVLVLNIIAFLVAITAAFYVGITLVRRWGGNSCYGGD
ncbi:hypothetical protein G7Y89_g9185 [Cudoniella acicularis]|uniref:DUF2428 domain-containing protein n=1 Tax=Cudoniella acicularis TaxID=354080 RepID=A0A8H4RF52_9HELO|nr:hypothetical protein G7Y89_g9185 [Cudoniella acicularis]